MKKSKAEVTREYGPFPSMDQVHGLTYDGQQVWFATGEQLSSLDPQSGRADGISVPRRAAHRYHHARGKGDG